MGGGTPRSQEGPATRTIYVLEKAANTTSDGKAVVKAVTVKTGISDGINTEVLEGLNEGDLVVSGLNVPITATAAGARPGASPFGGPFGGGGGGGGMRPPR